MAEVSVAKILYSSIDLSFMGKAWSYLVCWIYTGYSRQDAIAGMNKGRVR